MMFWILAIVFTLLALAFVWLPLKDQRTPGTLLAICLLVVGIAGGAYALKGEWKRLDMMATQANQSPEAMVASLASRVQQEGGTLSDYLLLGRSYVQMSRIEDAIGAYEKAMELSGGQNADVIVAYAEARAMLQGMDGGAGALFEQALTLAPSNPRALWYGGVYAREKGDFAAAHDRWTRLSEIAPQEIKDVLAPGLVELARLAGLTPVEGSDQPSSDMPAIASADSAVDVTVSAPDDLTQSLNPGTVLFVVARAKEGGPPLAVVRRTLGDLPLSLSLSDDNAMIEGNTISKHKEVNLSARLALRGTAIRQSGDLFDEKLATVGGEVDLVINQVVP